MKRTHTTPRRAARTSRSWDKYMRNHRNTGPDATVRRALTLLTASSCIPRVAVELGSGAGADTLLLNRAGFEVHAVDWNALGLRLTKAKAARFRALCKRHDIPSRPVHLYRRTLGAFSIPPCGILVALRSLGFVPRAEFKRLLRAIPRAIAPGGILVVQFFGPRDSWVQRGSVCGSTRAEIRAWLRTFSILSFEERERRARSVGGPLKNWHEFYVIARKRRSTASKAPR